MLRGMKGAIFDLDGTLLDSMHVWDQIDYDFLSKRGFAVPPGYLQTITPMGYRETARYTIGLFGLNETEDDLIAEWAAMAAYAYSYDVRLKPGAQEYLLSLKEMGTRLAIATATIPDLCVPALKNNGVLALFDSITYLSEVNRGKEFPDVYLLAAQRLGLPPEKCAVYEDILKGIEGANAGGFYTVGVYDDTSAHLEPAMRKISDEYIYNYQALLPAKTH